MEELLFKSALKDIKKILTEENLTMMFDGSYPIRLCIEPCQDIEGQMNMLEAAEIGQAFNAPGMKLVLRYVADDVQLEIVGRCAIDDDVYRKIRAKFKTACVYYMAMVHKLAMDNEIMDRTRFGGDSQ